MVNRGKSAGCLTCRQRRVKCDEAKPGCQACKRLGLHCGGYARPTRYARLKFRDKNQKFGLQDCKTRNANVLVVPTNTGWLPVSCSGESTLPLHRVPEPDTAALFYPDNYANVGRDMGSTRGFFELLIPTYFAQSQDSPLALAISALASEIFFQNTVHRTQDVGFIPEWERVVTPVVDYVLSAKSQVIDTDRLVLVGNSFGGYLAARAAALEPRLSAVILVGGVWDLYSGFSSQLSNDILEIYEAGNFTQFGDTILSLRDAGSLPTQAAWGLDYGLWAFKIHSPSGFFDLAKLYNIGDVVDRIDTPVFVGDAESEGIFPGQPRKVANALGEEGTLHVFEGVAGYHCQTGA